MFSNHISSACKKVKLRIYKAAILRYLTYCSLVWHFCRGSDRRKLERVNERGLRAAFCNWRSSYDELLTRARMTSLYNRRLQDIAILSVLLSSHNLRNSDFFIPRFNTVKYGIFVVRIVKKGQEPSHIIGFQNKYWQESLFKFHS